MFVKFDRFRDSFAVTLLLNLMKNRAVDPDRLKVILSADRAVLSLHKLQLLF